MPLRCWLLLRRVCQRSRPSLDRSRSYTMHRLRSEGKTMINEATQNRLRVATDRVAGPYLMVPMPQLCRIRELLDLHAVRYWVDSYAVSLDGKPAIVVVNFGRGGDGGRIQALLDEAG